MKYTTTCRFCGKVYKVKYSPDGWSNWSSKHFWRFHSTKEQRDLANEVRKNYEDALSYPIR